MDQGYLLVTLGVQCFMGFFREGRPRNRALGEGGVCRELLSFSDGRNDSTFVRERRGSGREGKIGSALER